MSQDVLIVSPSRRPLPPPSGSLRISLNNTLRPLCQA